MMHKTSILSVLLVLALVSGSADAAALRQRDMQEETLSYGQRVINWYAAVFDSVANLFAPTNEPLQQFAPSEPGTLVQAAPTDIAPEATAVLPEAGPAPVLPEVAPVIPEGWVVPEGNFVIEATPEATEAPTEGATEGATEGETTGASE